MKAFSVRAALVVVALGIASGFASSSAYAQCIPVPEEGSWINIDPNTRSLARAEVRFVCRDTRHCPVGQPCDPPLPSFYVSLYGACGGGECPFGEAPMRREGEWLRTLYDQGYALRDVWLRWYPEFGMLRIYVYNDFVDPNRADYTIDDWFVR